MILAFDIGNTFAKWGFLQDGKVMGGGRTPHRGIGLAAALGGLRLERSPQRVVAVNVAGEAAAAAFAAWTQARYGLEPSFVTASMPARAVRGAYREPGRLGADRWAAIVGAFHAYGAALIADLGTAATIDLVDAKGQHRGGYIVPGIDLMRQALGIGTEGVSADDVALAPGAWGRATDECVAGGGRRALASLVASAVADPAAAGATLVLTGGDAERVAPWLAVRHRIDHDLVLRGAVRLFEENA